MRTGKYELIIVWTNGDRNVYEYLSEQEARDHEQGFKMAFGNQIQWCGVRPQYVK